MDRVDFSRTKSLCIFGAGAIGAALAARLASDPALSDMQISVVVRGAHLQAIRNDGIHLFAAGAKEPLIARVRATDRAADLGPQDLVIVTLKGHQLFAATADIACLLKPDTRVVMIQNGIPWWYFYGDAASRFKGRQVEDLDPGGLVWDRIGPERVIGAVIYQGAQMSEPGHIHLSGAGQLIMGEPGGEMSDDLAHIAGLLTFSGWTVKPTNTIRDEIWLKLQGNAALNPLSALTRSTVTGMCDSPLLLDVIRQVMTEVRAVAEKLGCRFTISVEERIAHTRGLGTAKTSMLQDLELGRQLEITPMTRAVCLLGKMAEVPTPVNDTVLALITQLDRAMADSRTA